MRLNDPFSPAFGRARPKKVYGVSTPEPRLTWTGLRLALLWLAAPIMAGLLLFDLAVYAVGALLFGGCWAVWCVF